MKKVYLHGALGKRFGEKWSLNVSTPLEAIKALFANEPDIEQYLFKKQEEGVYYGIKKSTGDSFAKTEEYNLKTDKDIHVFAIPQGAGFAGSLLMAVATTAASMFVSRKMAEAMERDDQTVQAQTKSFLYSGGDNRFNQGASVPVGYGRMKVGTNVVSSCILNYDYNSEHGKIFNFSNGLYSLIPSYSDQYIEDLGPLVSCFAQNVFDGSSKYSFVDPAFQYITGISAATPFGAIDGMYGGFEPVENQRQRFVEMEGNDVGGYWYYTYNFGKGIDTNYLENFTADGDWWATDYASKAENSRYRIDEADAIKTSHACIQSVPQIEGASQIKSFYPISFAEESMSYMDVPERPNDVSSIGGINIYPIQVGRRWRNGKKEEGVGWFKFESTSIYKSIDLVSEGEIDGFAGKNGEKLQFNKDASVPAGDINFESLRYEQDDYLNAIYLDDTPVKEINNLVGADAYNINEFDIDVGVGSNGNFGTEDQGLLEPQYNFTAFTKEINGTLYGPRSIDAAGAANAIPSEEFQSSASYNKGQYVEVGVPRSDATHSETYRVNSSYGGPFDETANYHTDNSIIEGATQGASDGFVLARKDKFDEYQEFNTSNSYSDGDKVRSADYNGNRCYYKMGAGAADKYLGVYDPSVDYSDATNHPNFSVGNVFAQSSGGSSALYKITGVSNYQQGEELYTIGEYLSVSNPVQGEPDISTDVLYILKNEASISNLNIVDQKVDISPSASPDMWNTLQMHPEGGVQDEDGNDLTDTLNIFTKVNSNTLDAIVAKKLEEENYLSHTIINPLVEQAYVSLQIDELGYIYQGDEVEVEYKIGKLWVWLLGAIAAYYLAKAAWKFLKQIALTTPDPAPKPGAAAIEATDAADDGIFALVLNGLIAGAAAIFAANHRFKIGTKIENSGEMWPNKARFRIRYGNEGEALYETDVFMYGICTSSYRKDIKIYLPKNPNQRDRTVKVYKLNRERNPVREGEQAARYKDKMSLASVTEITPVQLNYANSVIIGTRVNAKDSPSMPKRTYNLRLKKMSIPSNYDPEKREYTGNWDGTFKPELAWTDNPAWCLYDLISNKRFGVGRFGIKEENVDRWTLYRVAKYCDELVPTGYSPKYQKRRFSEINTPRFDLEFNHKGSRLAIFHDDGTYESIKITNINSGTIDLEHQPKYPDFDCAVEIDYPLIEPRYTLNAFIMNKENAFKLINEFAAIFRTYSYWSGGAINFFQDEKKDPVMLFSNNNISEKGFNYSSTPKTSRTNSCNIRYTDRYNMFRAKVERAEDREAVQENNMIEQTIDGFGVTSQAQAKRAAEFVVKGANLETEIVTFQTSMLGSYLKPGDVIEVLDNKRTIGRFAGKVIGIDVDDRGIKAEITLDYPIHTYIDREDRRTWKNITLYQPSGNQTITSLDNSDNVNNEDIKNMRASQIGEYVIYDISEDNKKIKLYNSPYSYISGEYTWFDALQDSKSRDGKMATVNDQDEQVFMENELPTGSVGWLGGYETERPLSELIWHADSSCGKNYINYGDWAEGFPKLARPIIKDSEENLRTDEPGEGFNISADSVENVGNFLFVTGSNDRSIHGDWMHTSGNIEMGYMLEKVQNNSFDKILESEGTTFSIDDNVNLANKKQYKVMNINEDSNGLFSITALQYSVDKFDNIEKDLSLKEPQFPVIFNENSIFKNT